MLTIVSQLLTAFGLASASGLNAYIPLLLVALAARFTTLVKLNPPFDILTNEWVIGALVVLLAIEVVVDKVPAADTVNDLIQTFVRPAAGAILFAASTNTIIQLHPVVAAVLGLILAFGVHATKAAARPAIGVATGGIGNPIVSTLEDFTAAVISILALILPIVLGVIVLLVAFGLIGWLARRRTLSG